MLDIIVFGTISGSIILFAALGFSMILKTEGFINVGHGQMLMLGAYFGLLGNKMGIPIFLVGILAAILCGLVGMLIFYVFVSPIKTKGILVCLFTTVGVSYLINGLTGAIAGKQVQAFDLPPVKAISVSGYPVATPYELMVIIFGIVAAFLVHAFFNYTLMGKSIRAVSDNRDLAKLRGYNPQKTSFQVWFLASALAGLAGVFTGLIGSVHLGMGWAMLPIILAATVFGGIGSIYGVMAASFIVGIAMEIGILILPANYRSAIAFGLIVIVMLIRPEGLKSIWDSIALQYRKKES